MIEQRWIEQEDSMDAEIKRKWVEALRSGKYQQGRNVLRTRDDKYCCLGVLCDIEGAEWKPGPRHPWNAVVDGVGNWSGPPCPLQHKVGLTQEACNVLMDMNDQLEPFTKIADYIDQNL